MSAASFIDPTDPAAVARAVKYWRPPPELAVPAPRPIPPEILQGHYIRSCRSWAIGLIVTAVLCLASSRVPETADFAKVVWIFRYSDWIGLLLACWGSWYIACIRYPSCGRLEYACSGVPEPFVITQRDLHEYLLLNGVVWLVLHGRRPAHPEITGPVRLVSKEMNPHQYNLLLDRYLVGEVVTVVSLPHDPVKSARVYDFLELRFGLIPYPPKTIGDKIGSTWLLLALTVGTVLAFIYAPESHWFSAVLLPGLVCLLPTYFIALKLFTAPTTNEPRWHWLAWILFTSLYLSYCSVTGPTQILNRAADFRPSVVRDGSIERIGTWEWVEMVHWAEFRLKFDDAPNDEIHKYLTTLDYAGQFPSNRARVELGQGLFGWPYVRKLEPLPPRLPADEVEADDAEPRLN